MVARRHSARCLAAGLALLLGLAGRLAGDDTAATWTLPASLEREAAMAPDTWKYHAGDDPAWAAAGFDDSAWATGSPRRIPLIAENPAWPGLGWFRLKLDASAFANPVALVMDLAPCGAADVFLDGKPIARIGQVGAGAATESAVRRNPVPPLLTLTPGSHVLAVRYSNFNAAPVTRLDPRAGGFLVRLMPHAQWADEALTDARQDYGQFMFFMAVPLVLAVLHAALFCFAPAMRESLYCALFLASLSAMTFARLEVARTTAIADYLLTQRLLLASVVVLSLFGLLAVYRTFAQARRIVFTTLLAASLGLLVWSLLDSSLLTLRLGALLSLVVSAEAVRVSWLALRRGHTGAKPVLAGFALFAAVILYNTLRVFGWVPEQAYSTHTLNLGILASALGLSFHIASNYTQNARQLALKLSEVEVLSARTIAQEQEKLALVAAQNQRLEQQVTERTAELAREKTQSEELLHNILPRETAAELKQKGAATPRRFEEVTVLFSDFCGFTSTVSSIPAHWLIRELDEIFRRFDDIVEAHGLEKIKTIGDAYMAAGGLPSPCPDHAHRCIRAALAMQAALGQRNEHSSLKWSMRIGLHAGPLVAGVVGKRKFTYDVFGDTVNLASRIETAAQPGQIALSAYTRDLVHAEFPCDYQGKLELKGKGSIDVYALRQTVIPSA